MRSKLEKTEPPWSLTTMNTLSSPFMFPGAALTAYSTFAPTMHLFTQPIKLTKPTEEKSSRKLTQGQWRQAAFLAGFVSQV